MCVTSHIAKELYSLVAVDFLCMFIADIANERS